MMSSVIDHLFIMHYSVTIFPTDHSKTNFMIQRFKENPIINTIDIQPSLPSFIVECVLNPGVFTFENKTWLILRVAERPVQREGYVSFPVYGKNDEIQIIEFKKDDPQLELGDSRLVKYGNKFYLSTISHLRLVCSEDGIKFYEPNHLPTKIYGKGPLETYGIEDCRVSFIEDEYFLTYTQVSENGVGVGLMRTKDWRSIKREGMIFSPHNKDCCLFENKINDKYFALHRPSGIELGGNFIWLASSYDLLHWGGHKCIARTRADSWDSVRIGAGASPIKTELGWLEIYHGADAHHKYHLGAILLDLDDPSIVLARSNEPILSPEMDYETKGFFGNVVFTNGHLVDGDQITMYYGASDEVICGATLSINEILKSLEAQLSQTMKA